MTADVKRLAGRVALVTGASRGIGAAVARRFAQEGAELVLVARTVGGLEEADDAARAVGSKATLVPLDLRDFEAIDRLGASLYERFGRLDVLVGNAAMLGTLAPAHHISPADWQQTIDLNLTANWRLIRSLDPLLRQSPAGRAIFVTADVGSLPKPFWGAYAVSKAGLETLARMYAAEIAATSALRVNLINPGKVGTALRARAYPGEKRETLPKPDDVTEAFVRLAEAACDEQGSLVTIG
jgi:NAD(P)-dependent dehydrogenase (short-subunit alcohol dehydrogenase family)